MWSLARLPDTDTEFLELARSLLISSKTHAKAYYYYFLGGGGGKSLKVGIVVCSKHRYL